MANPVRISTASATKVTTGGVPVIALAGPMLGGLITNPVSSVDQGLSVSEILYVNIVNNAGLNESPTTMALLPGATFFVPPTAGNVSVNAASSGHMFSAIALRSPTPFTPAGGLSFPPPGPTTLTQTIPSYLYQEYADDDDLQAFVAAFNTMAQEYVSWFSTINLPVYTSTQISGSLLDWVAGGLYGMIRPALSSGLNSNEGPFNTYALNTLEFNQVKKIGHQNVVATSDDIFKRIMTWNFYKGDGQVFNVRWLKRRVMRFLIGTNGTAPNIDNTDQVSVAFSGNTVEITLVTGTRVVNGGAVFNKFALNTQAFNALNTTLNGLTPLPNSMVFQEAFASGALQVPFQFNWIVTI